MNYLLIIIFIYGLIFASFLNCLIWRLKSKESLWGRSLCPQCRQKISWYDNIPLLSFVILKGRCRHCQKKISWQYPLVEFIFASLLTFIFFNLAKGLELTEILNFNFLVLFLRDFLFLFVLTIIFVYDYLWQSVPMIIIWPGILLMILFSYLAGASFFSIILASALTAIFFLIQFLITSGRGLGEGDIWLGAFMGARLIHFDLIFLFIFSAYIIGSIIASFLLIKGKKKMKSKIPLGPFLVLGALVSLFFGKQIITWYLALLIF